MTLGDLLSSQEAAVALPAETAALDVAGLSADSRAIGPGFVFFAIAGQTTDGSRFVPEALERGAIAIVADHPVETGHVTAVTVPNARAALAAAAARFSPGQPRTIVAVTGTSGKTSVTTFVRQIWTTLGHRAASLGTIGVMAPGGAIYGSLTTPDPVALHAMLDRLAREGVTHLALEASSHGLDQHRLDGLVLTAAGFTNLSHDHLDYHGTAEAYLAAKLRLFDTLLEPGRPAVIDADSAASARVREAAAARGLRILTTGASGDGLRLLSAEPQGFMTALSLAYADQTYQVTLPLAGTFQVSNALLAAGLCIATGDPAADVIAALGGLTGAPGRLDRIGLHNGAPIFIDYAHKPDALDKVLETLRPYAAGRLIVVFGCGGDRDAAKRPLMGAIAARRADLVIVTDDNPRSEDAAAIRAAILEAAPDALEIADRRAAIGHAIGLLSPGDALVIAGKGHETGQIVGSQTLPFSDHEVARTALAAAARPDSAPLWTGFGLMAPLGARMVGAVPAGVSGISIDTRTLQPGDLFIAIQGEAGDGHAHVRTAFAKGAAAAVVDEAHATALRDAGPLYVVDDTLLAMRRLGQAGRARSKAKIIAVTGSVGKTSTKEALRLVLAGAGETHASVASYNNHWGVPLTLARMPRTAAFGVFEIGMNHSGEIADLVTMVRPHVAVITTVAPVHLAFFDSVEEIADAKAEIFLGVEPGGLAIINRDIETYERLAAHSAATGTRTLTFGEHATADARLDAITLTPEGSDVLVTVQGSPSRFRLGVPGRHHAINALAVLLAAEGVGVPPFLAGLALGQLIAGSGRGARLMLQAPDGPFTLIDESYNANPASMRAALALLGETAPGPGGRRIAALGEMRELGIATARLHAELAPALEAAKVDRLYVVGALAKPLFDAMAPAIRAAWVADATALEAPLAAALRAGDVLMVKGSNGSRMGPLVAALKQRLGSVGHEG